MRRSNLRTRDSSMTDALVGSAAHGLAMSYGDLEISAARGQNRDLDQPESSEHDGGAVPAQLC
eukprot:2118473-Prymnesium_polylepis.1